jgi:peroxiredoxin Q/BCP
MAGSKLVNTKPDGAEVGAVAPDFELMDGAGERWRLSSHRGKVVALLFYPRDHTSVCTRQMCSVRDRWADYIATGAEVVGISIGSVESHKKFAERHQLPQRLLADDNGDVARLLRVKSVLGTSQRAVVVIDREGVIRTKKAIFPFFRPNDDDVIKAIEDASQVPPHPAGSANPS